MTELRDHYVSLRRGNGDKARYSLLAGPFSTHEEALKFVDPARREARRLDAWTDFDFIGTCSLPQRKENKDGFINIYLGVTPRVLETA